MKYLISESQKDKAIKKYFDLVFKDYPWRKIENYSGAGTWYGVLDKNGEIIVGHPSHEKSMVYFNGEIFSSMWDFFQIDVSEFKVLLKMYVNIKYEKSFDDIY